MTLLLDYGDLQGRGIKYSKTHLWRLSKAGKFPQPVKLGPGRNAWLESEIDDFVASRIAARGDAA
jgi:prophage regulatory protein